MKFSRLAVSGVLAAFYAARQSLSCPITTALAASASLHGALKAVQRRCISGRSIVGRSIEGTKKTVIAREGSCGLFLSEN